MTALFWLFWVVDLLIGLLAVVAKGFRNSYTASDTNTWFSVVLIIGLVGGIILQLYFKKPVWAAVLAGMPLLVLTGWFLVDKN